MIFILMKHTFLKISLDGLREHGLLRLFCREKHFSYFFLVFDTTENCGLIENIFG
jgi:hypothetical protein